MTRSIRPHLSEVARGPFAVGLPVGSAAGAVIGGLTRDNMAGGALVGSILALFVVVFVILSGVYTGALGVPHRYPFRVGDRFMGWTVRARIPGHAEAYEVHRPDHSGRLTVAEADSFRGTETLRGIESRYLVRPLDIGRTGRFSYVVIEPGERESLAERVQRIGPLRGEELFSVACGIAIGLRDVHARGSVHGRVFPGSVLLGGGGAALCGFEPIPGGEGAGAYLAPEQSHADDVATPASDMYSWAGTVLFAATGRLPFDGLRHCPEWLRPTLDLALDDDPRARPPATGIIERLRVTGREYQWLIANPDVPAPVPATRPRVSIRDTVAVAMSLALAATVPLFLPAAQKTEPPAAAPATVSTPPATTTTTAVTTTSAPPTTITTTTTQQRLPRNLWPTAANDGTPAFYAYLGASFLLPDWVACETRYCLVGSGEDVYLFTARPIKEVTRFGADVPDPHQKLTSLGLTAEQADTLLNRP